MSLLNLTSNRPACVVSTEQIIIDSYENRSTLIDLINKCDMAYDQLDRINRLSAVCERYGYTQSIEALVGSELYEFMEQHPSCESITVLAAVLIGLAIAALIALIGWLLYKLFKSDDKKTDENGVNDTPVGLKEALKKIEEACR